MGEGGGDGGGVAAASVRVIMSGGQQGAYFWIKKTFCRWGCILLRIKNDDHLLTAVNGPVMRAAYIKKILKSIQLLLEGRNVKKLVMLYGFVFLYDLIL